MQSCIATYEIDMAGHGWHRILQNPSSRLMLVFDLFRRGKQHFLVTTNC